MQASNNSPLPKGDLNNQELKTKGTIWKPLIAVSLLSIFSFTAGQYLPYVIAAVSGSGAIAAVPLAIFAVSVVVALVLATYLIKLAVSRDDNKKEAGPDGKEPGHTASQEPQKFVCKNCTNLENKPTEKEFDKSVKQDSGSQTEVRSSEHVDTDPNLTPQQPPLTLGTAIPQNNNAPPPPPPMPTTQSPQVTLDTQPNPSVSVIPPPPPPPLPQDAAPKKAGEPENDNNHYGDWMAELSKRLKSRRKGISREQEDDVQQSNDLLGEALNKMSAMIPPPRSRSSSVLSDSGNVSNDEDWDTDPEPIEQASLGSQSLHRERSGSLDSGHGSDDNVKSKSTPPPHSAPKVDKPLISPKPVNLKTKSEAPPAAQVNNVDPVNSEVQEPSTSSLKDRIKLLNLQGGSPVFPH